jgi:hypothetical protein
MTDTFACRRLTAALVVMAILLAALYLTQTTRQADAAVGSERTQAQGSGYRAYSRGLRRVARSHVSFGYFQLKRGKVIDLGFVGPVPRDVRGQIDQAASSVTIHTGRPMWTFTRLQDAMRKVRQSDVEWTEMYVLDKGRGIFVGSVDRDLYRSHNPRKLLGVQVGVIARRVPYAIAL